MPGSSSILLIGSDGGAFSTSNADIAGSGTPTFVNMDNGLNTIEFYSGDISGNFATSPNPSAAGGAQDNAPSVVGFSGYPAGPAQWQMTVGGDGFYARIDPVGNGLEPALLRRQQQRRHVALRQRTASPAAPATRTSPGRGAATRVRSPSPFDLFHGGVPGGDDCAPAGTPGGCGHLVDGTTRVWETIKGGDATMNSASWYVTNNPSTQNMTKQSLGNRSFINQVKYSPKWSSQAIVGTNDANVWIGFNLGTGIASQANWVNVTGNNTVLPNRPVLGIALDAASPTRDLATGYAAVGGFNANTPSHARPRLPGDLHLELRELHVGGQVGQPARHPGRLGDRQPEHPAQVFAGTDWGVYYTDDVTQTDPTWFRYENGMPHAMIWDIQADRGGTTLSAWTRGRGA